MGKSSIHVKRAEAGIVKHNARENYSHSVVFVDEKNEIWNDSKEAFTIFRSELRKRSNEYERRIGQKIGKNAIRHLSSVINLEQHHTLKDLEPIKDYFEKKLDTKVFQISIHRDEGKLINLETGQELYSGEDFFKNPEDDQLYFDVKYTEKIDISKYEIQKNYHGHIEMMGLDSTGAGIKRNYLHKHFLSNLQDFVADTLKMERGQKVEELRKEGIKPKRRRDVQEFKQEGSAREKEKVKLHQISQELNDQLKTQDKIYQAEIDKLKKKLDKSILESNHTNTHKKGLYKKVREQVKSLKVKNKSKKLTIEELTNTVNDLETSIKGYPNQGTLNYLTSIDNYVEHRGGIKEIDKIYTDNSELNIKLFNQIEENQELKRVLSWERRDKFQELLEDERLLSPKIEDKLPVLKEIEKEIQDSLEEIDRVRLDRKYQIFTYLRSGHNVLKQIMKNLQKDIQKLNIDILEERDKLVSTFEELESVKKSNEKLIKKNEKLEKKVENLKEENNQLVDDYNNLVDDYNDLENEENTEENEIENTPAALEIK